MGSTGNRERSRAIRAESGATGVAGEDAAARYLCSLGHRILHRGWRSRHLEVDIVSHTQGCLHFVEVKTRSGRDFRPSDAVDGRKKRNLLNAARAYLASNPTMDEVHFDVVAVYFGADGGAIIEYMEEAFLPYF